MSRLVDSLGDSGLGRSLNRDQLERLSGCMEVQRVEAGASIMERNTPAGFIAFLLSGDVQVIKDNIKVVRLSAGNFFGEAMFSAEPIRVADIQAVGDVEIATLTADGFEELLGLHREVALRCKGFFEALHLSNQDKLQGDQTKYVALIAHNSMKPVLADFAKAYKHRLDKFPLVATGTTGAMLYQATGLLLSCKVQSGPLGGDQAIGAMIASGNISAVIFFRDPLSAHPHHADIEALGRLSDVYYVPFATNPVTAEAVLDYLEQGTHSFFANPSFDQYVSHQAAVVTGA